MIIETVQIDLLGWGNARLSWAGDPALVAYVFINGRLALEPQELATAEKTVTTVVPDPFTIEIHELDPDVAAEPASIPLERRPVIGWSPLGGAEQYRVYHMPDEGEERIIGHAAQATDTLYHAMRAPADLRKDGKRWGFLRVEALSDAGEQSARPPWPLLIAALPPTPTNVNATGGGGTFDLELEVSS